jgi:hypothetical protein
MCAVGRIALFIERVCKGSWIAPGKAISAIYIVGGNRVKAVFVYLLVVVAILMLIACAVLVCCVIELYQLRERYRRLAQPPEVARNGQGKRLKERI